MNEINQCPHCGDTFGWYTRQYMHGWVNSNRLFDTKEIYNSGMWDSLGGNAARPEAYCMECGERIGYQVHNFPDDPYVVATKKEYKEQQK